MIYVMSGDSGNANAYALINVIYPVGSTLTCSNGSKTLKCKNTLGAHTFAIPSNGTWTVTCTKGTDSVSQAVKITSKGQSENVTLQYESW